MEKEEFSRIMPKTEAGYRTLFFIAALWNLVLGFIFLVFFSQLMNLFGMPTSPQELTAFHQMAILLAMVYGIGYYMVSRELYSHNGIVILGIIGKLAVFFLFLYHVLFSGLHFLIFLVGVGDLIFSLLFLKFLTFSRRITAAESA
jgi:hypothetical protein